jgi:hypothetical protein
LYFFLIFSVFFPLRKVFITDSSFLTGSYSDFTTFSLYLSDILIIILFFSIFPTCWRVFRKNIYVSLLTLLLLGLLIVKIDTLSPYSFYFEGRLTILVFLYLIFSYSKIKVRSSIKVFVGLAAVQSVLAILQFIYQKSLGLSVIGESLLSSDIYGVAKIVSHGTKFIRGYGTLPHPNLLAAFLFTSILFLFYLIFTSITKKSRIIYSTLLILNIFGLFITFSRSAIFATIICSALILIVLVIKRVKEKKFYLPMLISIIASLAAVLTLNQLLFTRATVSDQAVIERKLYNQIGWDMVKGDWGQGTGLGRSILQMQNYAPFILEPWMVQPIHNYYLITVAELGFVGGGALILFIFWHLYKLVKTLFTSNAEVGESYIFQLVLLCVLLGYLVLMLFDHYFYTLPPTQILLWAILGIIAASVQPKVGN